MDARDPLNPGDDLTVPRDALRSLAERFHIERPALFGSAARGGLRPDSDVDLPGGFHPGHAPSLWTATVLEDGLARLIGGRPIDLVPPEVLRNPYRRRTIERGLKVLFDEAA
jgi:hypothetical protein